MSQLSSSISSSERKLTRARATLVVMWTIIGLALIDVGVNAAFPYPANPKVVRVGQLKAYFDYGRSAEGKLARMTRPDPERTAPITLAGWYEPLVVVPMGGPTGAPVVSFYGMSHSVRLARALAHTTDHYQARSIGAPAAPANWAFGAFLHDRDRTKSKAAVLSIMSMTAPMVTTMTALTWNSDFPMPYTEDRFEIAGNDLRVRPPPFDSFAGFTRAFYNPEEWSRARAAFKKHDSAYRDFLMRQSILDKSAIVRLIRRGYALHVEREASARVLDQHGFQPASEEIRLLNGIVRQFAAQARKDGIVPVVFVINNLGYGTHLYDALRPTLAACDIAYLNSAAVVSPSDPRGYLPDSHFTAANDEKLAKALEQLLDREIARADPGRNTPQCESI